ncbi:MAG: MOSC N-terminal beta barrel domain-containing protein [Pseudomonadales bacterium]
MKVTEIWRYPVKSMAGEQLTETWIGEDGLPGDRAFAVRQNDNTRNAKKFPQLMQMRAYYPSNPEPGKVPVPLVSLAGEPGVPADDPAIAARISKLVGADISLEGLAPKDDLAFYERKEKRTVEESRAIYGLTEDEPFPDVSKMPARVAQFATPPGTFFDCFPLLVMTTASLKALAAAAPDSVIDVRRFRPNILIDTDETGFVEQDWVGKTLQIGATLISCEIPCPRCVMTTIGFHDLPRDTSIMRTLVRECGHELGIYAEVKTPGQLRLGDEVVVLG